MRTHLVRLTAEGEAALARWRERQEQEWIATAGLRAFAVGVLLTDEREGIARVAHELADRRADANMGGALIDSYRGW